MATYKAIQPINAPPLACTYCSEVTPTEYLTAEDGPYGTTLMCDTCAREHFPLDVAMEEIEPDHSTYLFGEWDHHFESTFIGETSGDDDIPF